MMTAFIFTPLEAARPFLIQAAPDMPPDYWWITACVLVLLALTATVDAFTLTIPDKLIFLGLLVIALVQGLFTPWHLALLHLGLSLAAGLLIWAVNFVWYSLFKYDALGMGDAKWTMLAVICFGIMPCLFAWGIGAVLAALFILALWPTHYRVTRVTFAPFLMIGLLAGLFWTRF